MQDANYKLQNEEGTMQNEKCKMQIEKREYFPGIL